MPAGTYPDLAGIELTAKRVERSAEADGELVRMATEAEADAVLSGRVVPMTRSGVLAAKKGQSMRL